LRRQGPRRASGDSTWQRVLESQATADDEISLGIEQEYRKTLFQTAAAAIENEFTRATWQAFWQTAVEARPIEEVARELGISAGAVYIARSRVLAKLRERVQLVEGRE
jgi:RNA polymerase sigma-70 factor (ECF subfamily)